MSVRFESNQNPNANEKLKQEGIESTSSESPKTNFLAKLKDSIIRLYAQLQSSYSSEEVGEIQTETLIVPDSKSAHDIVNELLRDYHPESEIPKYDVPEFFRTSYKDIIEKLKNENEELRNSFTEVITDGGDTIRVHTDDAKKLPTTEKFGLPFGPGRIIKETNDWIAANPEQPLIFISIDLKGMKRLNDSRGSEQADLEIKRLVEKMLSSIRPGDTLYRNQVTGDEFSLVMPRCNLETAHARLLEFQNSLEQSDIELGFYASIVEYLPESIEQGKSPGEVLMQIAEEGILDSKRASDNEILSEDPSLTDTRKAKRNTLKKSHITIVNLFQITDDIALK